MGRRGGGDRVGDALQVCNIGKHIGTSKQGKSAHVVILFKFSLLYYCTVVIDC